MAFVSGVKNFITGRGRPIVTGRIETSEIDRLDALLNEIPTRSQKDKLQAAEISKIHGTYRGPRYVLEAVGGSRSSGVQTQTIRAGNREYSGASTFNPREHSVDVPLSEITKGEAISALLTIIHTRAKLQRIGGAR